MSARLARELSETFPHVDLARELGNMQAWLSANMKPYAQNMEGFVRRWLERQKKPGAYEARRKEEEAFQLKMLQRNERWALEHAC